MVFSLVLECGDRWCKAVKGNEKRQENKRVRWTLLVVGRPGDGGKEKQCRRIIFEIQRKRRCRCDRKNDGCRDTLKPPLGVTVGMQDNHPRMQGSRGSMVSRGVVVAITVPVCNL